MGQISTKYFFKLYRQKIFAASFESYIQLVLKTSFTSFLQPAWIETDSIVNPSSAVGCVQPNMANISFQKARLLPCVNILDALTGEPCNVWGIFGVPKHFYMSYRNFSEWKRFHLFFGKLVVIRVFGGPGESWLAIKWHSAKVNIHKFLSQVAWPVAISYSITWL